MAVNQEDDIMWNDKKSIALSKVCVLAFICVLVVRVVTAPWLTSWFLGYSHLGLEGIETYFLVTTYLGAIPAAYLLYHLWGLLRRIETDQVFIMENIEGLRRISWSCFAGALIGIVSAFYFLPWIFLAIAAAFMGLIVRVVKNVFAKAVELQNEVDYTV